MSRPQEAQAVLPPSPPSTPIRGVPFSSAPSLPRPISCSSPQSPPPEVMTKQDWEEVWEIEYISMGSREIQNISKEIIRCFRRQKDLRIN